MSKKNFEKTIFLLLLFFRYVKRSLPFDPEHPRERFEATEELMIVINFEPSRTFLDELTKFFSSYGKIEYVGYEFAETFRFVLLKFTDRGKQKGKRFDFDIKRRKCNVSFSKDSVDQIILDKPHFYNDVQLDVMKYIENNIELTSAKFANSTSNDKIFQREKFVKELHDDFERKRQSLEEDSKEQCDALEESTKKTRRLHDELQKSFDIFLLRFFFFYRNGFSFKIIKDC